MAGARPPGPRPPWRLRFWVGGRFVTSPFSCSAAAPRPLSALPLGFCSHARGRSAAAGRLFRAWLPHCLKGKGSVPPIRPRARPHVGRGASRGRSIWGWAPPPLAALLSARVGGGRFPGRALLKEGPARPRRAPAWFSTGGYETPGRNSILATPSALARRRPCAARPPRRRKEVWCGSRPARAQVCGVRPCSALGTRP